MRLEIEVALDSGARMVPVLLPGTATYLGYTRAIDELEFDGRNLRFETRTQQSMGNETREPTHRYTAELLGQPPDERLALRMQTSGAFHSTPPLEFEARRDRPRKFANAQSIGATRPRLVHAGPGRCAPACTACTPPAPAKDIHREPNRLACRRHRHHLSRARLSRAALKACRSVELNPVRAEMVAGAG